MSPASVLSMCRCNLTRDHTNQGKEMEPSHTFFFTVAHTDSAQFNLLATSVIFDPPRRVSRQWRLSSKSRASCKYFCPVAVTVRCSTGQTVCRTRCVPHKFSHTSQAFFETLLCGCTHCRQAFVSFFFSIDLLMGFIRSRETPNRQLSMPPTVNSS